MGKIWGNPQLSFRSEMLGTMNRRDLVFSVLPLGWPAWLAAKNDLAGDGRAVRLPADFGAHPSQRTEWWYLTGSLEAEGRTFGFQVTFFRSRTPVADAHPSRFAARQLVFAHAALSDVSAGRQRHDQRVARAGFGVAATTEGETGVHLRDWRLQRSGPAQASQYTAQVLSANAGFRLNLTLSATQPPLLQGVNGLSLKAPQGAASSLYYSEPQLDVRGTLTLDGRPLTVTGRAWLDHEWADSLIAPGVVGWDWIGMNLADGSALTAFQVRRADGSVLYAGGSFRPAGGSVRSFAPDELQFTPGRRWTSPASGAHYPVAWQLITPTGRFTVRPLMDAQELDSRQSTGAFYWEGLSDLLDAEGRAVGRGYLEMTGYAAALIL